MPAPDLAMPESPDDHDITRLLAAWSSGDDEALEALLRRVYGELRQQAGQWLSKERPGHTLQARDLVHEAFLRLVDQRQSDWQNRRHFFAVAARIMRRILVDHARRRGRAKRWDGLRRVDLDLVSEGNLLDSDLVAVDEALRDLAAIEPELASIVELRFFAGLNHDEIAELLGISKTTARRRWRIARAWLYQHLSS